MRQLRHSQHCRFVGEQGTGIWVRLMLPCTMLANINKCSLKGSQCCLKDGFVTFFPGTVLLKPVSAAPPRKDVSSYLPEPPVSRFLGDYQSRGYDGNTNNIPSGIIKASPNDIWQIWWWYLWIPHISCWCSKLLMFIISCVFIWWRLFLELSNMKGLERGKCVIRVGDQVVERLDSLVQMIISTWYPNSAWRVVSVTVTTSWKKNLNSIPVLKPLKSLRFWLKSPGISISGPITMIFGSRQIAVIDRPCSTSGSSFW